MKLTDFVWQQQELIFLRDGTPVRLRPILSQDKAEVLHAFERLSLQSRYQRFFSPLRELSPSLLAYLTDINYTDHFAYGAFVIPQPEPALIGVARYIRLADDPQSAEAAIAVIDDYHRRGLGKQLLCALARVAIENGISRFLGNTFWENRPVLGLLRQAKAQTIPEGSGVLRFVVDLSDIPQRMKSIMMGNPPEGFFESLPKTTPAICHRKSF
jgi:GNAT superfamily N-acetyltransferase